MAVKKDNKVKRMFKQGAAKMKSDFSSPEDKLDRIIKLLKSHMKWRIRPASAAPVTGEPLLMKTEFENSGGIVIDVSRELLEPLFRAALTPAERLSEQWFIANTILRELMVSRGIFCSKLPELITSLACIPWDIDPYHRRRVSTESTYSA